MKKEHSAMTNLQSRPILILTILLTFFSSVSFAMEIDPDEPSSAQLARKRWEDVQRRAQANRERQEQEATLLAQAAAAQQKNQEALAKWGQVRQEAEKTIERAQELLAQETKPNNDDQAQGNESVAPTISQLNSNLDDDAELGVLLNEYFHTPDESKDTQLLEQTFGPETSAPIPAIQPLASSSKEDDNADIDLTSAHSNLPIESTLPEQNDDTQVTINEQPQQIEDYGKQPQEVSETVEPLATDPEADQSPEAQQPPILADTLDYYLSTNNDQAQQQRTQEVDVPASQPQAPLNPQFPPSPTAQVPHKFEEDTIRQILDNITQHRVPMITASTLGLVHYLYENEVFANAIAVRSPKIKKYLHDYVLPTAREALGAHLIQLILPYVPYLDGVQSYPTPQYLSSFVTTKLLGSTALYLAKMATKTEHGKRLVTQYTRLPKRTKETIEKIAPWIDFIRNMLMARALASYFVEQTQ